MPDKMNNALPISIDINRKPSEVYEYASNPKNLPLWASGLARSEAKQDGDWWTMQAPFGKVKVKFAPHNTNGILDHDVQLESGMTFNTPMRVVPHGNGSQVTFTLNRQPNMTDEQFANDKAAVTKDLAALKALLEKK